VIGIDDHHLSEFFGLTPIAQFPTLQGRTAVEILMDELHLERDEQKSLNALMPCELIVRSSTARANRR